MKRLNEILGRLSDVLNKDTRLKSSVIEVVRAHTRATLMPEDINLKDGILELSASQVAKNEIKLKEELIKKELKLSRIIYK